MNKIWGIASTASSSMSEAIKETTGRSAFQQMSNHFKWDSYKCRLCHTVASLHLLPPELIEAMRGSKEAEIEAVQMMKDEAKKPGSIIMGPQMMSKTVFALLLPIYKQVRLYLTTTGGVKPMLQ